MAKLIVMPECEKTRMEKLLAKKKALDATIALLLEFRAEIDAKIKLELAERAFWLD